MAGIINRVWEWNVFVDKGGTKESGVKIFVWDNDETNIVNLITDTSGTIATQELIEGIYSVTLSSTVSTNAETPHRIRALKYGLILFGMDKIVESSSTDTLFVFTNSNITETTKTVVTAWSGVTVTHASNKIGIASGDVLIINKLYDYLQAECVDTPQYDFIEILTTSDSQNYSMNYDLEITGVEFDGDESSITMKNSTDITMINATSRLKDVSIIGSVKWHSYSSINNVNVDGVLEFTQGGTYNLSGCIIDEVTNTSGSNIIINASNGTSINTNTGPNITINNAVSISVGVKNTAGTNIPNANVLITSDSGGSLPYLSPITIARSGSIATVTHSSHGRTSNEYMIIRGADQTEYCGLKQITVVDSNTYTFNVSGTPTTPATGTITGTSVVLTGLTDANGEITNAGFNYMADQPIKGTVRKGTSEPYYQSSIITGLITSAGYSSTIIMVSDS